jgi:ABC-type bacteriocin/lantibiotic exporter with double-glycine peptidase domain
MRIPITRRILLMGGPIALASVAARAQSQNLICDPPRPPGVERCVAGIPSIDWVWARQKEPEWCWAACISMVFNHFGHPVAQERIVSEAWGAPVNMPGTPLQIMASLNRQWIDDQNNSFTAMGDTYSANVVTAAQDLSQGFPLIIGTGGHAVVLTALVYDRDKMGRGIPLKATVRDPWPGKGRRDLSPAEWNGIAFAARIRVI